MSKIKWDETGGRFFETGLDRGVLFLPNAAGVYDKGVAWNGLISISEAPSGAEANPQYADNIKYLNLVGPEEFGGTIEAFTYPDEFEECDGTASPRPGVSISQQRRKTFGLSYRTLVGNDIDGSDHGYKLHLVYGCLAAPSEKSRNTMNESPEAMTFSWEFSTSPVTVELDGMKPTSTLTLDSTKIAKEDLEAVEALLYGDTTNEPMLPLPDEVFDLITTPVGG